MKPTTLMRWLVRLVTPAGGVVLDPFMGSGSTGKAAVLEGFRFVGIEMAADYLEIARRRIGAAGLQPMLLSDDCWTAPGNDAETCDGSGSGWCGCAVCGEE